MTVYGSLKTMSVSELLGWISQFQKTGTLEVRTSSGEAQIAFEKGALIFSASSNVEHALGRMLIRSGFLSEEAHETAREVRAQSGIGLGKVLIDLNFVREEDLVRTLRLKAEDEIYGIFLCDDGEFRFLDEEMPHLDMLPLRLDLTKAVLKVTQRIDEGEAFDADASGSHFTFNSSVK